jgi:hypothetical protein
MKKAGLVGPEGIAAYIPWHLFRKLTAQGHVVGAR